MKQQSKHRAQRIFESVVHTYPNALKWFDVFRKDNGSSPDFTWPDWCFSPIAGGFAIVSEKYQVFPNRLSHPAIVTALGAWRQTKGVYRFDDDLLPDLLKTDLSDLPKETLLHLPEWCMYIELDNCNIHPSLKGVFVHLEYDTKRKGQEELRLLFDLANDLRNPLKDLVPIPLILTGGTIEESIKAMFKSAFESASIEMQKNNFTEDALRNLVSEKLSNDFNIIDYVPQIVSLILYICHTTDIKNRDNRTIWRSRLAVKSTKNLVPPSDPHIWDVGTRMGAALKLAHAQASSNNTNATEHSEHRSPRPHIRRAHWHTYRFGRKKTDDGIEIPTNERELKVKWLPPIPVNIEDDFETPTVIHKVKG